MKRPWEKVRADANRLIAWWSIVPSDGTGAAESRGWGAFVDEELAPQFERGFTRAMLHNYGGGVGGGDMQFSQALQAMFDPAYARLGDMKEFVRAFRPVTAAAGREVIVYFGHPGSYDRLYGHPALARSRAAIRRAVIDPLLEAGVHVALDAASGSVRGDATHELLGELRGTRAYIEALAPVDSPHLHAYPSIVTPWFLAEDHTTRPVRESDDETIVTLNGKFDPEHFSWGSIDEARATVRRFLAPAPERSVAIQIWSIRDWQRQGLKPTDLIEAAGADGR